MFINVCVNPVTLWFVKVFFSLLDDHDRRVNMKYVDYMCPSKSRYRSRKINHRSIEGI